MFISMLKKEFIQFYRTKSNIILLFLFPIILITTLSVGLENLMTNTSDIFGKGDEYSKVYYSMSLNSKYKEGFLNFKEGVEDTVNIKFEEVNSFEDVKEEVDNYKALIHIDVNDNGFSSYSSSKGEKMNSKIFRSIFESILNEYSVYDTIAEYNPAAFSNLVQNKYEEYVVKEGAGTRSVTSSEYYTFAELALIILFIAQTVGESVYNETKLRTIGRVRLSKVREGSLISAKASMGIIISIIQTVLIYVYSSFVLDVNWGSNSLKFILLFIIFGIFSSVLGVVIGLFAKKDTTVASVVSIIIVVICALGGCYTPLNMIVSVPILNTFMYLSPIYWINTATSTMICGVKTNAYQIALFLPIVLTIICLIIYYVYISKKEDALND